jgi:serine/threonine protein kinase
MLHPVSDDDFARHVKLTGMATPEQIEDARKQAPIPLAEALVKLGVITPLQRNTVEKKLEAQREGVGELAGCRLLKKIGEGGMGAVYLAEDPGRKRRVAIKVLPKKHAADAEFLKRFRREAEAAAKLDHPNIVQAYSAGEDHGYHFYVMEYCEGESLRKRIERLKFVPAADACGLVAQVARGLQHAHGQGFIHRDVKPENIIVTPASVVKILDLGLAKNLEDTNASFRTVTGAALGTPHYISPEQARGDKDVDGRTDIYSLGATFYHLVTGQVPFQGSSIFEIIQKHLMEQLADPRDVRPGIPETVVQVLRKMLAKSPSDRHRDCAELISDLERILAKQAPLTQPIDASLSSVALAKTVLAQPPPQPGRSALVLGGAAASLLIAGILTYALLPSPKPLPETRPPRPPERPALVRQDPPRIETPKEKPLEIAAPKPPEPEPAKVEPRPEPERPKPEPEKPKEEAKPEPKPEPPKLELPPEPKGEPAKPSRLAVPDAAKLRQAESALKENYRDDYARKTPSDNLATAKKLLAIDAPADPAANYARLLAARNFAAQGGDAATALAAADRLAEAFTDDVLALKTEGIVASVARTTDGAAAIATAALALTDEAIQADRYDLAARLAAKAKSAAEPLKNEDLKSGAASREKVVSALLKEFQAVAAYAKTLAEKPDDPVANTQMGRFVCFVKEDWERGLELLAKGSDAGLKSLAGKELAKPEDAAVQRDLCEGWLALAEREPAKGLRKDNLTERSRMWFAQVESKLLPADRTKLAGRLEKLEKAAGPKTARAPKAAAQAAPLPFGAGWLNLTPTVDVTKHSVNGTWQRVSDALVSPATGTNFTPGSARLWVPYSPPDDYELILTLERTQGNEDLVLGLMMQGKQFAVAIDGWGGQSSGAFINGRWERHANSPAHAIPNNKSVRLGCFMRRGGFSVAVDGRTIMGYQDYSSIGMPDYVKIPGQSDGFILGSVHSVFRVTRIDLNPLSGGQGKVIR